MSFTPGDTVRVSSRRHEGHHRTPTYLKGRTGTVERVHERFLYP
jgi:nitrile hydratase subunit beta